MAKDYARIHRLLEIITLIQGQSGWTVKRLALHFGKTERTIFRDMQMLEGAKIPYFYDSEQKCYGIRRDFFLPPVELTLDEALALAVLSEHVGEREQVTFFKPASRALAKIRTHLPEKLRQELAGVEAHVSLKLASSAPPEAIESVYDKVRRAIARKRSLECEYESATASKDVAPGKISKPARTFLLNPYTLMFNQRAWYVVGHHSRHKEVRTLRLSRFVSIKPTEEPYAVPKSFKLEDHLGHAWRMIKGTPRYDVELHFDPEFADTVSDTRWHATQEVVWNDDGSITFTATVDGLDEVVWWVLSMGPHCVVRRPKELADRVKSMAREMVKRYDA